jgi:hypothetical protein
MTTTHWSVQQCAYISDYRKYLSPYYRSLLQSSEPSSTKTQLLLSKTELAFLTTIDTVGFKFFHNLEEYF